MVLYTVIDKSDKQVLADYEILDELNRDRSDEWSEYNLDDLHKNPKETLFWIDTEYYEVIINEINLD